MGNVNFQLERKRVLVRPRSEYEDNIKVEKMYYEIVYIGQVARV